MRIIQYGLKDGCCGNKKGERYKVQNEGYLYINYLGLKLCIEHCIPIGRVLNAIRQEALGDEKEAQVHIPVSDEEMSMILSLHEKGLSNTDISKKLGHDSRDRVSNALSRYRRKKSA